MPVNLALAFIAGLISFLSPCIFPVIPSYLTYVGGMSLTELSERSAIRKLHLFLSSLLFVLGFTIVFTVMGVAFSAAGLGAALGGALRIVERVAGVIVIILGLNLVFDFWKALDIERRFHTTSRPRGAVGSLLLGMAFGAGWSPCIGPILASILFLAGSSGSLAWGTLLLVVYSLGLGVPFLLTGLFFTRLKPLMRRMLKHVQKIRIISGILLGAIGVLLFTGRLSRLSSSLFYAADAISKFSIEQPVAARVIYGSGSAVIAALVLMRFIKGERQDGPPDESSEGDKVKVQRRGLSLGRVLLLSIGLGAAVLSLLSFFGVLDPGRWLVSWLVFQGI